MPKIAQIESRGDAAENRAEKFAQAARQMTDSSADAARDAVERAQMTSANVLADRGEVARRSSEDLTKSSRMLLELFAEQTRHGLEAAAVLTRAVDWTEIFAAQRDFFSASVERGRQLNDRYREMMQLGTKPAALPVRR